MPIHRIKTKAMVIFLFIAAGFFVMGVDSHPFSQSACACLSINEITMHLLNKLNSNLQDYAAQHSDHFPSYSEFRLMSAKILPELNGQPYPILSQVNQEQHCFNFIPGEQDLQKIGYAPAPDQRSFVLIGVGKTETYRSIRLFGVKLYSWKTGVKYPVLQPGDPLPPDSSE